MRRKATLVAHSPSFKFQSDDLVHFAATAATLAKDISNMSACPPAAAAASVVLLILETIQDVKRNQEGCARLVRRCAKILVDLDVQMAGRWESAPASLIKNLEKFRETLWNIHRYMALQVDVNWRTRFVKKGSIADNLAELDGLLSDASQSFQMSTLISIHHAVDPCRKKASNDSSLEDISENELQGSEESLGAHRTQALLPIELDRCRSFRDQPEYDFHHYVKADLATCGQNVRQYRFSDVHTRPRDQPISGPGWWSDMCEADLTRGKFVLVKRYDRDGVVRRERWLRELALLRRLYHPSLPQLIGSSLKNSPVPFVLLEHAILISPQEAILQCLHSTSLKECSYLVLRFFHQIQSVAVYLLQSSTLLPMRIQNFLEDASIGVEQVDSIMVGLPVLSEGHIATHRNYGLLESTQTICLNMLPRSPRRNTTNEANEDGLLLHDLFTSVLKLVRTHHIDEESLNAPPTLFDEECLCNGPLPYDKAPNARWVGFCPFPEAQRLAAWDFGYIPKEKGIESFVKLGNLIKDELGAFSEEETVAGLQWATDPEHHLKLPYLSLPDRVACWPVDVPPNSRVRGQVTHKAHVSEEDAWRFLLRSGETLAEEFKISLQSLRIVTSLEHKLDFDISCYKTSVKWDRPPAVVYLLTALDSERTPFLSTSPIRGRSGVKVPTLEHGWTCAIRLRIGAVQTVAVTGPEALRVLSGSPPPDSNAVG